MKRRGFSLLRPKQGNKTSNTGWNVMMGAGGAQQGMSMLRGNPQSTNSIRTYNPFAKMLDATGAGDFDGG